jgi:hypothetical protein
MPLCGGLEKVEEIAYGANLISGECLDGKIACNDHDNSRVEIIC